jgi:hypothetical protein
LPDLLKNSIGIALWWLEDIFIEIKIVVVFEYFDTNAIILALYFKIKILHTMYKIFLLNESYIKTGNIG